MVPLPDPVPLPPLSLCPVAAAAWEGGSSVGSESWCFFGELWGRFAIQDIAESPDCRSIGRRGGGRWALGLLYLDKSSCLTLPPFWDCCGPVGYTTAGKALSVPPALALAGAPGASHPKFLQDQSPGLISTSCSFARAQVLSPQPSSPSPPCPGFSQLFLAQLGPGSPVLCQSQHGPSCGPVVTVPSSHGQVGNK